MLPKYCHIFKPQGDNKSEYRSLHQELKRQVQEQKDEKIYRVRMKYQCKNIYKWEICILKMEAYSKKIQDRQSYKGLMSSSAIEVATSTKDIAKSNPFVIVHKEGVGNNDLHDQSNESVD